MPPRREMIKTSWSASGVIKTSADEVRLQANFEVPGYYTIQFGANTQGLEAHAPLHTPVLVYANIIWSTEGNSVSRTVSVVNGCSISGAGQGVQVVVKANLNPNQDIPVSILCIYGTRPSSAVPPVYQSNSGLPIGDGVEQSFAVPEDVGCTGFYVMVHNKTSDKGATDTEVTIKQANSHLTNAWVGEGILNKWIPLTEGCDEIRILNNTNDDLEAVVLFSIDG